MNIYRLFVYCSQQLESRIMKKSSEIYQQRINQVQNYVNNNLAKSLSLEELAAVACFSPFHFHRIFVAVTGESVNFFTNRRRLEKAARLLKYSKDSLSIVAMECGFSSPATFSRSFKKYFGISPSTYKSTGKIENSKICKELFPLDQYLVPMSEAELRQRFPVTIKEFPQRQVAYIPVVNSYQEGVVIEAFEKISEWAKKMNLFESETIFGMSLDDPLTTPQDKCRYEVCISLPDNFQLDEKYPMELMTMPKCKYGVTRVSAEFNIVATAINYLFGNWLVNSEYEPEHLHGMEIFLDNEKVCDWSYLDLELCIPVKTLKK